MFFRTLTTTLALAGAASALVVPSPLLQSKEPTTPSKHAADFLTTGNPRAMIELACPSCPLAVGSIHGHPRGWSTGPDTKLLIELTSDGSQIMFNGNPVYPLAATQGSRQLAAKQEYLNSSDPLVVEKLYSQPLPLSSSIAVQPTSSLLALDLGAKTFKNLLHRVPMLSMEIEIMGLGDKLIKVDTLRISFSEDKLRIHDATVLPYGSKDSEAEKQCSTVLCRLRTDFLTRLATLRGKVQPPSGKKTPCAHTHKHKHETVQLEGAKHEPTSHESAEENALAAPSAFPHPHANPDTPTPPAGMPMPFHAWNAGGNPILAALRGGRPALAGPVPVKQSMSSEEARFRAQEMAQRLTTTSAMLRSIGAFSYHIILPVLIGIGAGMLVSGLGMLLGQCVIWTMQKAWGTEGEYEALNAVYLGDEEACFAMYRENAEEHRDAEFLPKYSEVSDPPPQFEFGADEKTSTTY